MDVLEELCNFEKSRESCIERNGEGKFEDSEEIRFGRFDKHMIKGHNLERYVGKEGITQIIIEYNNDLGKGWMRSINGVR